MKLLAGLIVSSSLCFGFPILYKLSGNATGVVSSLGTNTALTNTPFTVTLTTDTNFSSAYVTAATAGVEIQLSSARGTFTEKWEIRVAPSAAAIAFTNTVRGDVLQGVNSNFKNFQLTSGPTPSWTTITPLTLLSSQNSSPFSNIPTTLGNITFISVIGLTFTAVPVPGVQPVTTYKVDHQCPVKYFTESDKTLAVSGLRRYLPCRDLNGDWLQ